MRTSRLQVASELAQTQLRIDREDERLWILRARIAERITPSEVERLAADIPLRPLIDPVLAPPKPNAKQTRIAQREPHR
jgi:hypothetical protein